MAEGDTEKGMTHPGTGPSAAPARPSPVILFATHAAPGGIRELWESLEEGLAARGYDTRLWALYRHEQEEARADGRERWSHVVPHPRGGPWGAARRIAALAAWLRRTRPAVILSAMPLANIMLAPLVRLFSPATRIIETHHTPLGTYHPLLRRLARASGRAPQVATILCVSRAVARSLDLPPALDTAKCRVVPNAMAPGVEAQLAALAPAGPRSASGGLVCAVGRLTEQKNFPALIRAAALVPGLRVEIIGGGPDEAALAALINELGVADRVSLLGQLPRAQTLARLARADIFVQVSRWEGHSLALIEAAKLALPLVVSDVPVQVEGITARDGTRCGLIAAVDNPAEIAERISMLIDSPDHYRHWSALSRKLGGDHGFDALCDSYAALIEQAAFPS